MLACTQINRIFCPEPEAEISMNDNFQKAQKKEGAPQKSQSLPVNAPGNRESDGKNFRKKQKGTPFKNTASPGKERKKALTKDEITWKKDPEAAFKELESFSKKAEAAWHFIQKTSPIEYQRSERGF